MLKFVSGFIAWSEHQSPQDAEKEFMGLTTFAGNQPTSREAVTAKNYLDEKDLRAMGQLVLGYLDFAERQAQREQAMTMKDWAKHLDRILTLSDVEQDYLNSIKILGKKRIRIEKCNELLYERDSGYI